MHTYFKKTTPYVCSFAAFGVVLWLASPALAAPARDFTRETPAQRERRMAWFEEARFGMFIHWGLYAVPAGEWKGKPVSGIGEWIMERAKIPVSEYEPLAQQFNPVQFDATEWVRIAKDAGMKYLVITSKHHDGFGLWRSDLTDWCIKSSPFQRDPLKELADACKQAGIRLCFYHSIMDWHHPDWGTRRPWHDTATGEPNMDRYVEYMKGQLKELITRYGPLGILWFDGEWEEAWTHERGVDLYNYVRSLQPDIIVNNRVGKGRAGMSGMDKGQGVGDYGTPEQEIPPTGFGQGVYWESCMTMNNTWGFRKDDHQWKPTRVLIHNLVDCASKGGNYLLNIGPTAEGLIPRPSIERLAEVGQWMRVNSESIHGTQASPFEKLDFGRCTQKALRGGKTRLYLHVFDRPADGKLALPGLANRPIKAFLLDGGASLEVTSGNNTVIVALPSTLSDKTDTVVVLDIKGKPEIIKPDPYADETPAQKDARMQWWREARFGMFIHWGVYAVPAGTYNGKQIGGIGEWIMQNAKIPMAEYQQYARQFNPVKYDADAWVRLAKEAGMKYIVITSKHHDGFALSDSQASDWNIVRATPYGKDLLSPLAAACRKHGLKLGFYYSQAQDWNNGGSAAGGKWDKAQDRSMDEYIDRIAVPQVRELLTRYGDFPDVLWWDTPTDMNTERAEKLLPLLRLKPGIIVNNRLGGGYGGDTETPEQYIPATGYPGGRDFEVCMTMNDTWGFKNYDHNWKSTETLLRNLIDIASKGGNYLLNIGPTAEGLIPGPSVERLKEVGTWMKANGEAIHGTSASPFKRLPWGRCTKKVRGNTTTLYFHVFDWPADGRLLVPGLQSPIEKAWLLTDRRRRPLTVSKSGVSADSTVSQVIAVPSQSPNAIASVIVAQIKGAAEVMPQPILQAADRSVSLPAAEANLHGNTIQYEGDHTKLCLGFWTDSNDWADWNFRVTRPGRFVVVAQTASQDIGASLTVIVGDSRVRLNVPRTGDYTRFQQTETGTLEIPAGTTRLIVRPVKEEWKPVNLRSLVLKPAS